ncbi:DUF4124 domain-containing protein [Arenimonas composti]|uniref:DUF4124 domain-containing protein n=1 Tax=Arenimonas composti TR7-09 = DSM 18010 TaxID=1121013 RepID=A0A091BAA5_9GAMM|nr:DUF4124 domain-containing protein [Arenimonas composti]KFN49588.1 hypothetical protein P873_10570 [Arenimonas composti TR7-09 = DSM 18010]
MKPQKLFAALVAALVLVGTADAQQRKLYRWVDKDGKVQFSDALPPEAVDQARSEISATSGRVTATIDRALTAEERAALEAQEAAAAAERAAAEKALQTEQAMLGSFQTEDDLRRSFRLRQELLNQTLEAIEAAIAGQRDSLTSLLAQAAEAELAGRAVGATQVNTIRELHREIGKQQQMLIVKQAELVDLDGEVERLVTRFHELRGEDAPPTRSAAGATPPTSG